MHTETTELTEKHVLNADLCVLSELCVVLYRLICEAK